MGEWKDDGYYHQWIAPHCPNGRWWVRFHSPDGAIIRWYDDGDHVIKSLSGHMELVLDSAYMRTLTYHSGTVVRDELWPYSNLVLMRKSIEQKNTGTGDGKGIWPGENG